MSLSALYDLPAPAKINQFLHIVGRRSDGYHLLQSVFVLIDWADTLHFEKRRDGRLARHDLGPTLPADDLCLRAAHSLQQASGTTSGADISVLKQVPWGAGMGGGSSDAATTLLALNRLWGLNWPRARLALLGLSLGADVPFFIGGRNAFVQGIGERLTPLALPRACVAVVKPAATIATRDIFEHPALVRDTEAISEAAIVVGCSPGDAGGRSNFENDRENDRENERENERRSDCNAEFKTEFETECSDRGKDRDKRAGGLTPWQSSWVRSGEQWGRNDLQAPAEDRCVEVRLAAEWLQARYGNSRMTGSGSAVFARLHAVLEESKEGGCAPTLATFPQAELPAGWSGRICYSLPQHPMLGWAD